MLILAPGWREGFAIRKSEFGIRNGKTKVGGAGDGDFAMGIGTRGVFCNARGEVGFSHNSPRWWGNRVAKADRGKRKAVEETREIRARAL